MKANENCLLHNALDIHTPNYGHKYKHFSIEEIKWVCDRNGGGFKNRIIQYKGFADIDLLELEKSIISNGIQVLKRYSIPNWYIMMLIHYNRVELPLENIMKIRFIADQVIYEGAPFIDIDFFEKFLEHGILKLKYNADSVKKCFRLILAKMVLFYQCPISHVISKLNDFREIVLKISEESYKSISAIKTILSNMGYTVDISRPINQELLTDKLLKTDSTEIRQAFDEYKNHIISFKKTYPTLTSHIREFFNFMTERHNEVVKLNEINNSHIVDFIKYEKEKVNFFKRNNTPATINHRIQALDGMLRYFRQLGKYDINDGVISKYDHVKEYKTYPVFISKKEIYKLLEAVKNIDETKHFLEKMALIILIDTGRRIHEVLSLKYDCLIETTQGTKVHFHKTKNGLPYSQYIGEASLNAILQLRNYGKNITNPIYSKLDGLTVRRLFPSNRYKSRYVINSGTIRALFYRTQIFNGIIDENGKAKYTLHDNKRNFVSNMLSAGVSPEETANFLSQNINSLLPYEVNNELAIQTLKKVELKGLLIGKKRDSQIQIQDKNERIIELLKNIDVINRHKENLIYMINNQEQTVPLIFGNCTDNNYVDVCGSLLCCACKEFQPVDINEFESYSIKIFKHIYKFKRYKETKKVEAQILKSLENIYFNFLNIKEKDFNKKINELKRIARGQVKMDAKG